MIIGRLTSKSQITIPSEIIKKLNLKAGDYLEFSIEDGKLIITPVTMTPKDQVWYWSKEWQKEELEAEEDIKAGRITEIGTERQLIERLDKFKID